MRSDYDIEVNAAESRARHAAWEKEHAPLTAALAQWEKEKGAALLEDFQGLRMQAPQPWLSLTADKLVISGANYAISTQKNLPDGSYLIGVTAGVPETYTFTTKISGLKLAALRLEALTDKSLPNYGPGWSENGEFKVTEITATAKLWDGKTRSLIADGGKAKWSSTKGGEDSRIVFVLPEPLDTEDGAELSVTMKFAGGRGRNNLGRFRLDCSSRADIAEDAAAFSYKDFKLAGGSDHPDRHTEAHPSRCTSSARLHDGS
ncbi:MAG: hypothetical protein WDN28_16450 [Chthoniobacter sp.]